VADERNDKPSGAHEQNVGGGKDVLFGWLVGRAAADLGLAEAIAASEAQRAEQIKRLEETLLAQVRELQRQQSGASLSTLPVPEIGDLHGQIQSLTHRLGAVEESFQQAGQAGGLLEAEIAALTNQITNQRSQLDDRYLCFEQLAATLGAKVRDIEQRLSSRPQSIEISGSEIGELHNRLQNLADRITDIESASNPNAAAAERDAERARWTSEIDERSAARIRELGDEIREKLKSLFTLKDDLEASKMEAGALGSRIAAVEHDLRQVATEVKADFSAQQVAMRADQSRQQASEDFLKELDDRLSKQMGDLEVVVREKFQGVDTHRSELGLVQAQVLSLSRQVADIASRSEKDAAQAAAQARWAKDHEQTVAARLGAFADKLNEQGTSESRSAELGSLRLELRALIERMGKMEFAAQQQQSATSAEARRSEQAANRLTGDFAAFKADLTEQLQNPKMPQALIQGLERTIDLKFQEMQKQIGETQKHSESGAEQLRELGRDLQTLAQRLANAESVSHRTHALMVNESEQTAQARDGLRLEIDSLQAQLSRSPWSDAGGQQIEEKLNIKIRELESQLAQKMRLLDYRDTEFRDLKTQVQSLSQRLPRVGVGSAPSLSQAPAIQAPVPSVVIPMDINALRASREDMVGASKQIAEDVAGGAPAELQGDASASGGANKDHMRHLQERISADIERARAELREKSGRWKVRR
jgi:DNA repair exonuclease SbcCD ATPase subunit